MSDLIATGLKWSCGWTKAWLGESFLLLDAEVHVGKQQ